MAARLLVGFDGAPGADRALHLAGALARPLGATVRVCCVIPRASDAPLGQARVDAAAVVLRTTGLIVETTVVWGDPVAALNAAARHADALIVGRCRDGDGGLGGTAAAMLERAPCPVILACRPPERLARIVVVCEPGDAGAAALQVAAAWGAATGALLDLVQVSATLERAGGTLVRAAARLRGRGLRFLAHPLTGEPADALDRHLARHGGDLLILGAGTAGVRRLAARRWRQPLVLAR